ncbi:lipase (class 3) [Larkinella arboricola]|uniref:Lipase (Class 3) n=1 Tax=Larkinella arboricola TaxID=643671 RepID=A0A327WL96_LARAB|nr:lipase family protein [Larkinella arboricola]RAJ92075.1 lipase (class 3) [Larkinella arboricola]
MRTNRVCLWALSIAFLLADHSFCQSLKPGFDQEEYRELMYISARTGALTPTYYADIPEPKRFKRVYRSPIMGLDNLWDLWTDNQSTAVISIRGTTDKPESWIGNFYAAMVPAKGELKLTEKDVFTYELAANPKAAVHVGWLLGMAYLSRDILPKIDSCYKAGTRNILLMGHSQGGAINFLLTSYLYNLQKQKAIPADIRFKTYCSAGPKPGNLYYAYAYETLTQNGWAFNVVNSADWVPQTPMSIQTMNDYNNTNPFVNAKAIIKKQKFWQRIALNHVFNKLNRPTRRAQKNYEKYLGKMTSGIVRKSLKDFVPPDYFRSNDYVRTGASVVLLADSAYYELFPDDPKTIFVHHFHKPYLYLLDKLGQ